MGLRDRLRARQLPTASVRLPLDPVAYAAAEREVESATWALEEARARGSVDVAELRARVAAAREAFDACEFETVTVRALPPSEWEALLDEHPPNDEQRAAGAQWNLASFRPALLAASVVPADGDEPSAAEEWEQFAKDGTLSAGELNGLFNAAVNLNLRVPSSAVGNV